MEEFDREARVSMGGGRSTQISELEEAIIRLGPWHHEVQVTPELSTAASIEVPKGTYSYNPSFIKPRNHLEDLLRRIYPEGLEGRTFLDSACNGGGYCFAAKDLGASECFGFDARKHWIDQARFLNENRSWPTDGIRFEELDLYDLPTLGLEPFDVTLFKGIFYHLPDPITGLKLAADLTREVLIINTATLNDVSDGMLALNPEGTERPMSGVHGLAWFPTGPEVLSQILKWMGFAETRLVFWVDQKTNQPRQRGRLEMVASRKEGLLGGFDALEKRALSARERIESEQGDEELRRQTEQLKQHNRRLRWQRDSLKNQLDSATGSRTWRLLTAQRKLRMRVARTLKSIGKGS